MSTYYSTLKSPVTHIAVEDDRVTLSVNGLLVGVLVVPEADLRDFIQLFFSDNDVLQATSTGIQSQVDTHYWRDNIILLSGYGELTTWGAIKREARLSVS